MRLFLLGFFCLFSCLPSLKNEEFFKLGIWQYREESSKIFENGIIK